MSHEFSMADLEKIYEWLVDFDPDEEIDYIIDTAMNRCNVKKNRREHVARCIWEAFRIVAEKQTSTEGGEYYGP